MEEDLHGPGIDARGAAFPGVNLYVQLGHGRDYAWSATTATSDNVDTFAEVLCQDDFHYLYKGKCLPMEKLERTNSWTPNAVDPTAAGLGDADRLPHGARDRLRARQGAAARRSRSSSARTHLLPRGRLGARLLPQLNEPGFMTDGPQSFQQGGSKSSTSSSTGPTSTPSTSPTSSPAGTRSAPPGTSPDFPILGTGEYDWQGFDPDTAHARTGCRCRKHPHAIDPALPRLLEQQAGAGLGGGRRQVRLRPDLTASR